MVDLMRLFGGMPDPSQRKTAQAMTMLARPSLGSPPPAPPSLTPPVQPPTPGGIDDPQGFLAKLRKQALGY